ncbi:hypothetical protein [Prochlorococcus marinus]|uniref:Uncharacterized protein n=1 Tax=Prochlorococcus marinus XMU1408 TaxID=2213228 RepID=A0A318R7W7_PROMR|nr:hypothetical protein [Prochlorococcus marinus]MBW3042707.1 hypothetical protein [Prochlorococcus marinus str. XMU1408]PYE01398.1 hypothetical protein DNJ73_08290 [Prochlorococcus marinus XMU1408]
MEFNQDKTENSKDIVNKSGKVFISENIESLRYLYPNGHRLTHQMRWFKGSTDRGSNLDIAV